MFKSLVVIGACLAATLSASVLAAEPTYVVGSGGT
jgi:polar amino acid transport system substrate-binding protein